jgi:hypothetical protein
MDPSRRSEWQKNADLKPGSAGDPLLLPVIDHAGGAAGHVLAESVAESAVEFH